MEHTLSPSLEMAALPTDNNSVNGMKDGATKTQKTALAITLMLTDFLAIITLQVHLGEISKQSGALRL